MKWTGRLITLTVATVWLSIETTLAGEFLVFQFLLALPLAYFFGKQYDKSTYYHQQWRTTQEELNKELTARLNEKRRALPHLN